MKSKHTLLLILFVQFTFFIGHTQSNQGVESVHEYYSEIQNDFERIDSLRAYVHPKNGGNMQESIQLLKMEATALGSIADKPLQHVLLNNLLFKCHRSINEYHKGVSFLMDGKKIADKYSEQDEQWENALAEMNLETAFVHYSNQNPTEGFAAATRALSGYKKLGNDKKLAESNWRLGIAKSQMGSSQEALFYYEEAEDLIDQDKEEQNYLRVQYLKSIELAIQNKFAVARRVLLPVLPKMKAIDHPNYAVALAKMGHVETQLGNLIPAKKYLSEAEELKINTTDLNAKAVIAHRFEEYYLVVGEFQNAYDQLAVRKSISDSISRRRIQEESFAFKTRVQEISQLQENKNSRYEDVIQESKWKSYLGLGAGLLLALLGFFWYRTSSSSNNEESVTKASTDDEVAQVKKEIANNVTGNLRTPLALISSQLKELKSEVLDVHASLLLNSSINSSKNLFHKVNDLNDINQFETKSMMKNETDGDLVMFLDEIFQRARKTRRDKEFIWEKSFEHPYFFCKLDYVNLNSILNNLISNAVEYCPSGSTIKLAFHQKRDFAVIKVIDNGPGIESAHQPHIFNWYFNNKRNQEEEGESGYGLALSKELSEIMNGTLTLDSQIDKGCQFELQVPFKPVDPETQTKIDELMHSNGNGASVPVVSENAEARLNEDLLKLLLVESNEHHAEDIKGNLPNNYIVTTFPTASAAESWAMENMPDIILTALELPDMSGFQLSKSLKNNILTDHIPVVICTIRDDNELKQEVLNAQADGFLTQPVNEVSLHSFLKKINENYLNPTIDIQSEYATNPFFNKLHTVISSNFEDNKFDASSCANLMYFSPALLAKKTKVLVDKTPSDLIEKFRIDQSNQLLEVTELSVGEISVKCGFSNPETFNSAFQKYHEVSPSEYRASFAKV